MGLRLTNLKGIAEGLPKTPAGAREALLRYEKANSDIPAPTRRLMALSACGGYFKRQVLEAAAGQSLPRLVMRDTAWRWWNALDFSGLGWMWPDVVDAVRSGGQYGAAKYIRRHTTPNQYLLFLRRLGTNPHGRKTPVRDTLWTKGGNWRIESPLTKLLVLKQHLPPRPEHLAWHVRFNGALAKQLERELMGLIDPDLWLSTECKYKAVEYAEYRMPQLLGWPRRKLGKWGVAWFFQQPIPFRTRRGEKTHLVPDRKTGIVRESRRPNIPIHWSW